MKRLIFTLFVALSACTSRPELPVGQQAYASFPAPNLEQVTTDYRIGALDKINITVFQEPELSLRDVQVDAGGNVLLPLIGSVAAAGKTSGELSQEIAERLNSRFLVDPQVSVIVASSVSQKVTVEGSVEEPGVYEVRGQTTLLEALAMAKGPSRVAALDQVAVFRTVNGQQMGALFDVRAIRRGEAADPEIRGNDKVVVGLSNVKSAWRDALSAVPVLALFRPLGY
ncbi:MAG TPA: polysaccharide biosynthesis/export family protein [Allosphingosinicella sp.]|uniref:polysaccharide biosynthesis/export family protein n=1 Tax=Allosphingosinicella sp. TaxID=2823234 RepID=UPI002ED962B0